jgi:hypothetical protein
MDNQQVQRKRGILRQLRRQIVEALWSDVRLLGGRSERTQRLAARARETKKALAELENSPRVEEKSDE